MYARYRSVSDGASGASGGNWKSGGGAYRLRLASRLVHGFPVQSVVARLRAQGGGYEIVHESPGLEFGVYVLVAPEPDRQQPHEDDEVYVVLEGTGALEVEGEAEPPRVA